MNRGRRKVEAPPGPTGSSPAARHKPNRLSRSFRQSQQAETSEFKTPTRIPRSRVSGGFSSESWHNDSDVQQDIIWDATSPSPQRHGKRGKKHPTGVADISEIVSRIAPKHGRPTVAEPTLQQWIGDSAAIPATPDVQVPKPRKKSQRLNRVDDLLKLAQQFDFNMFRQDDDEEEEEEVEDLHQQSLELLSENIVDFENDPDLNDVSPSLPGNCRPAGTDVPPHPDQHTDDDLDFLFDAATQHVSGDLSQFSSAQTSQVKPAPPSHVPTVGVSMTHAKRTSANDEFEDDWENDDLLNDSLVLEITQNPQNFAAPKHCSTQRPSREIKRQSPQRVPTGGGVGLRRAHVEKENVRQRTTFKLGSNCNFSMETICTNTNLKSFSDHNSKTAERRFSGTQRPQCHQSTSASNISRTKMTQSCPNRSSPSEAPAGGDFLDEDLESFFSCDPVWDDPADDDLLYEMCNNVENQIQSAENVSNEQTHQRAALQPSNRNQQLANQQPASGRGWTSVQPLCQKQTPLTCGSGRPATGVPAGVQDQITQSTNRPTRQQESSRIQSAAAAPPPQRDTGKHQFTFKKPNNLVSTVTNTAAFGKCSAAEIELKKQQAMERRRQRLQAVQNLRAPT
ncbi:hypothetical protein PAMA_016825 [Pampus argenteus]